MNSLRGRLLAFLLTLAAVCSVAVAVVSYRSVLRESDQLFDYHLRQMALSLRDQGAIPAEERAALADPTFDYVVQVWTPDGTLAYSSSAAQGLPRAAVLGFEEIDIGSERWRLFSTSARGRVIQVGQPLRVREELAVAAAGRSALPLLAGAPLVAAALWWLVSLSLQPLKRLVAAIGARNVDSLEPLRADGLPAEVAPLLAELNALLDRLRAANDAQRAFVADAAHELRSPLTAISLQLGLAERAGDGKARAEALDELRRGVDRLRRLVEQLLSMARAEVGGAALDMTEVNLCEIARQATAETVPIAHSRRVQLEFDDAGPVSVVGDAAALRMLARNLIDNAVRYAGEGGRANVQVLEQDGVATLRIDDSGPGIDPADRVRVFDRFFRRAGSDVSGSGLGLAIVDAIARRHGARISLDDAPLGGLRAEVRMPRSKAAA